MTALYLTKPAILTALGEGIEQHLQALLNQQNSPLALTDEPFASHQIEAKQRVLGQVAKNLRPFPADLPAEHHSRNNQLLWDVLQQLEPQIALAIERFGHSRVAVVIGSSTTGADENIPVFKGAAETQDYSLAPFNMHQELFSAPADFVAQQYGLTGLVYGISTACTSGARALISAARLLKANLCDAVICGGVDTLSPLTVSGFDSLSVLAYQRCNPFSANRQGINIGEGAGLFVMSREPLDNSQVQFLGYGSSSDAYHMSSPHPEGEGAIAAFQNALRNANIAAESIGWINLHGTGTIHNDQMESLAIHQVFGDQTPCTSTKSYTGHTLGAAGAVEAAILWGVLDPQLNPTGKLPAQLWDQQRDPALPAIQFTDGNQHWPAQRIGASCSFAFGGNNAVLVMATSE